jgi:hypothetical protein
MNEKRRILQFVFSNSTWKDGRLHPVYHQPFGLLAVTNREYQQHKAASLSKSNPRSGWLPIVDEVRTFFESMSEEIVDTIVVAQGVMAA